ncbi:TPX2, C-terminal [Parasponia andersonii]|uniref:TPX2, C-terminal n=1 Tax=Parasponia andersonii TaxID=3476 RepID=A0A2P5B0N1_PARAD|nr:TPX2, C-terminal [Parasponia andersonii]
MAEPACLRRSFSHPSESSREAKEGDPFRALGESISFGRFMSESLAWEKWSAFSHNRYLEEVERFSKPGSVAEKKAYFEAHYKKKAAERAAALLEAAKADATKVTQSMTEDRNCQDSSVDSDLAGENVDEQPENDVPNTDTLYQASTNVSNVSNSSIESDESDVSTSEGGAVVNHKSIDPGKSNSVESNVSENNEDQNKIDVTVEENMLSEEAAGQEIVDSRSNKRLVNSSSKISSKQVTPVQNRSGNNLASRCKNFMHELVDKKSAKSLHMSFHFSYRTGESCKTISPFREKIISSRDVTASLKLSTNNSNSSQTKTKVAVNGVAKRPSLNLKSEDRSSKSLAGGITADRKQNSPSPDNSKSSNGKGSKPRSSIISSPFRFKSDERAAKRKEARLELFPFFYEKLEEKRIAEEAEKKHQQTRFQGNALQDLKKMRQSTSLKGKTNEDLSSGSQFPNGHTKKIPLTRPRSPILGRKATSQPPSATTENPQCVKNNRTTNRSLTSRFQKNAHENASPNIQSSAFKR